MKKILLSLFFSLFVIATAVASTNPNQEKIDAAFGQSFVTQQNQVESVISSLKSNEKENVYWISYGLFYSGIYSMQMNQKGAAEKSIQEAIDLLQKIENKTSEEHALLGCVLGFSIALNPSNAVKLGAKSTAQYEEAIKKDAKNMRAYVGLGEGDYHKPVNYGGGKKVEEYLIKAIALPEQSTENGPSWGKNIAYHTLASFYLREGQKDKAKMYCMQGLSKFPQDYRLNQLKQTL